MKKILVPVDVSASSQPAVEHAALLAQALGAKITLLHVFEARSAMESIVPGANAGGDEKVEHAEILAALERINLSLAATGRARADVIVDLGPLVETILARCESGSFDMIVMATHGRTGMQRLWLGSVAEGVLRRAKCPVVTLHVPSSATDR